MADDLTVDNGGLTDYKVSADEDGDNAYVQRVKLAYSADGSKVHIPADANGLLVNLGTNNDVTVTGTVDLGATDNAVLDAILAALASVAVTNGGLTELAAAINASRVDVNLAASAATVTVDGSGVTQPVSGTVTANLSAVDNAVLDAIVALLTTMDADTGALVVDLAAIETLLTQIDADTSNLAAILTALQLIDNAIAGNEMQVDVVSSALPAGAATEAKQPALGTAGTPSADVISIQGVASGTVVPVSDGGGVLTVDGTVTANLSAVDNAVLDAIEAATEATQAALETAGGLVVNLGANNDVTVTGTVTANLSATDNAVLDAIDADLTTIIGHVDGIEGHVDGIEALLGTIDADTSAVAAAHAAEGAALGNGVLIQGDDGTDRTNVLVDTDGHLQVDVLSGGGGGVQYTEGDADASITGTAILWEDGGDTLRAASAANPFPVEIVAGAGSGGTAAADDADFTAGTTSGTPVMGVYQSTPGNVTDGDLGIVGITEDRALRTVVEGTVTVDLAANNDVTVTGTVDLGATDNAVLDAIAASVAAADTDLTTIIGHVDGIEGLLTTIDADTGNLAAIAASLALLDNAIATGNELQVDVVAALPAGDNNIGNVDAIQSGTWTVDLGATDNAVLDSIDADLTTIIGHVDGIEGHVDGIETLLGTIDADTSDIHTNTDAMVTDLAAIEVLLGTIDADTGAILTAAQLLDDTVYVDDADWTDGTSKHLLVGGLYQSTPQTVTDGDVAPFNITANGALHVAQQGTVVVDLGANNDVTVTGTVDLGATDNAVLDDIAAKLGTIDADTGAIATDAAAIEVLLATLNGLVDGLETLLGTIDTDTGAMVVDLAAIEVLLGTIDADTGNLAAILTALQLIDNPVAVLGTATYTEATSSGMIIGAVRRDADTTLVGTTNEIAPLQVDANGRLKVEAFSGETLPVSLASVPSHAVTNAGTFVVQENGAALTALQLIDNSAVNHDAAVVAGVNQIGLDARSTDPTAVASGDAVRAMATLLGKQVVMPYAIPARTWQYASVSGGITDTGDDVAQSAGGAGVRHYITHVDVVNAHATVGTEVVIKTGSTVIWRGYAAAAGGGISAEFPTPLRGGANEAINVTNITTGSATYFNLTGYTAAE